MQGKWVLNSIKVKMLKFIIIYIHLIKFKNACNLTRILFENAVSFIM